MVSSGSPQRRSFRQPSANVGDELLLGGDGARVFVLVFLEVGNEATASGGCISVRSRALVDFQWLWEVRASSNSSSVLLSGSRSVGYAEGGSGESSQRHVMFERGAQVLLASSIVDGGNVWVGNEDGCLAVGKTCWTSEMSKLDWNLAAL